MKPGNLTDAVTTCRRVQGQNLDTPANFRQEPGYPDLDQTLISNGCEKCENQARHDPGFPSLEPKSQTCLSRNTANYDEIPEKDTIITLDSSDNKKESVISQCVETVCLKTQTNVKSECQGLDYRQTIPNGPETLSQVNENLETQEKDENIPLPVNSDEENINGEEKIQPTKYRFEENQIINSTENCVKNFPCCTTKVSLV